MRKVEDVKLANIHGGGCRLSSAVLVGVGILALASVFTLGASAVVATAIAYGGMTSAKLVFCMIYPLKIECNALKIYLGIFLTTLMT
jgi:hypothetical protein